MDLDSFITFILFLLFFILPSIIKQVKARKKKSNPQKEQKVKKPSIFTKISDQIGQFVQELEQQARQQKEAQAEKTGENIWETLSEDEDADFYEANEEHDAGSDVKQHTTSVEPVAKLESDFATEPFMPVPESDRQERRMHKKKYHPIGLQPRGQQLGTGPSFRQNQLQNAIVWSEILSKPIALRDND